MISPVVHVGYHKTATSWLQERLFDDAALGFRSYPRDRVPALFVEMPFWEFDATRVRGELDAWLRETVARRLVPVVTHERLSGYPHSGGFDSAEIAGRLAAVLPEARVVLVFREQAASILSNYQQYVRDGGASPLERYLDPPQEGHRRVPGFSADFFAYDCLISHYRSLFGIDRVLALPYEWFRSDALAFLRRLLAFAGVQVDPRALESTRVETIVNAASSPAATALLRWANLLFRANPLHPAPLVPSRSAYRIAGRALRMLDRPFLSRLQNGREERQRRLIGRLAAGRYRASNTKLAEMTGFDLAALGYDVETR